MAAEIGTKKVISEHSTIGLVVTTDGTISDIPRAEYAEAEQRVIAELRALDKPFIVLLNSTDPDGAAAQETAREMGERYGVPVLPVNCLELEEAQIRDILSRILLEFPVKEVCLDLPHWLMSLERGHWLRTAVTDAVRQAASALSHMRDVETMARQIGACDYLRAATVTSSELSTGSARIAAQIAPELFYKVLTEATGLPVGDEQALLSTLRSLADMKKAYDRLRVALDEVDATGYGIVMPTLEELRLEEPEIMRQGGRYGVRLRASAPSLHIMKTDVMTEVAPIVGSESQSEELVMYLLREFEENPSQIWDSNIFGKSLHELVNEGLHNKLYKMPADARARIQETLERVINEGCSGLICIIL
jgi:stage IV sporulation protein A